MIFNPIFLQVVGQTETIDLPKQLKLKTPGYLFSDIIKIVGTGAPNKNPDESLVNADSIKSIQSGLQNILQSLNLNQKVQSPESKDSLNPNDASVSADIAAIIQAIQNSLNPKSAETKIINKTSSLLNPNQIALQIDNIVQTGNLSFSPVNDQQNINNSNNLGTVKSSGDSQNSQDQNLTDKLLLSLQSGIPLSLNVSLNGSNYIVKFNPIIDNGNNIVNVSNPFGNDSINHESNKIYLDVKDSLNNKNDFALNPESLIKNPSVQTVLPELKIGSSPINDSKAISQQPENIKNQVNTLNENLQSDNTSSNLGTSTTFFTDLLNKGSIKFSPNLFPNTVNSNTTALPYTNKIENNISSKILTLTNNNPNPNKTESVPQSVSKNILVSVESVNPSPDYMNSNLLKLQLSKAGVGNWMKTPTDNISLSDTAPIEVNQKQLSPILPESKVVILPDSNIKNVEEIYTQNKFNLPDQNNSDAAAQVTAKPAEDQKIILQNLQNTPIANSDQPQTTANHLFANDLTPIKDVAYNSQDLSGDQNYKQNDNLNDLQKSITKKDILPDSKVPDSLNFLHDLTSVNKSNLPQTPVTGSPENLRTVKPSDLPNEISHLAQSSGTKSVVLNLDPDTLGKVKIVLDLTDKSVRANIQVDNEGAKQAVQNNINELKQSLNLNGLQLSSINISLNNNDDKTNKSFLQKKKSTYNQYNPKIEETENSISSKSMGYNTYDYLI